MRHRGFTPEHVGEWKVTITGHTLDDVFVATARIIANAAGHTTEEEPSEWEFIEVTARDVPTLLVDWANELLGRSEVTGLAYSELHSVRLSTLEDGSTRVSARVRGRPVAQWTSPLKAATYHALSLEKNGDGKEWRAEVLFDV